MESKFEEYLTSNGVQSWLLNQSPESAGLKGVSWARGRELSLGEMEQWVELPPPLYESQGGFYSGVYGKVIFQMLNGLDFKYNY
jgi:hypothetical protein